MSALVGVVPDRLELGDRVMRASNLERSCFEIGCFVLRPGARRGALCGKKISLMESRPYALVVPAWIVIELLLEALSRLWQIELVACRAAFVVCFLLRRFWCAGFSLCVRRCLGFCGLLRLRPGSLHQVTGVWLSIVCLEHGCKSEYER